MSLGDAETIEVDISTNHDISNGIKVLKVCIPSRTYKTSLGTVTERMVEVGIKRVDLRTGREILPNKEVIL